MVTSKSQTVLRIWPWFASASGGAMLALCYPGWDIEILVWFAPALLLAAAWTPPPSHCRRPVLRAALLGYLGGVIFFFISLIWMREVIQESWSFVLPLLLALYLGFYTAVFTAFAATVGRPRFRFDDHSLFGNALANIRAAFLNAAAWTGLEWLRGIAFTGFGWDGLGVALWKNAPLIQIADTVGVTGIAFLVLFVVSTGTGLVWRTAGEFATHRLRPHIDFALAAALVISTFFYGVHRLHEKPGETIELRTLIVQANIPIEEKWDPGHANTIYQTYRDLTEPWVTGATYDLVIWPESSLPYQINDPFNFVYLNDLLTLGDFALLLGANEESPGEGAFNTAAMLQGEATRRTIYRKIHLVPFGEYIPLRGRFSPFEWFAGGLIPWDFDRGTSTEPIPVPSSDIEVIPAICFEDTVGRLTRKFVRAAPQLIVTVTNDGWFRESAGSTQHLANAVFRCIELRRPMARAANTGISCIIDETGSLYDRNATHGIPRIITDPETESPFTTGCLSAKLEISKNPPTTFYSQFGDLFSINLGLVAFLAAVLPRFFRKKR